MGKAFDKISSFLDAYILRHSLAIGSRLPSVRKIAELTGFSPLTVQRSMSRMCSEEKIEVRRGSGYYMGRFYNRDCRLVGIITLINSEHVNSDFLARLVAGAEETLQQNKVRFVVINPKSDDFSGEEQHLLDEALRLGISGLLVNLVSPVFMPVWHRLFAMNIPVVCMNNLGYRNLFSGVATDNFAAGIMAAEHLIALGHRRIGILAPDERTRSVHDRIEGFKYYYIHRAELPQNQFQIFTVPFPYGENFFDKIMASVLDCEYNITAFFVINDMLAVNFAKALQKCGIRIPEDVSVLGVDDNGEGRGMTPLLSFISQRAYDIGKESAGILIEQMNSPVIEKKIELLLKPRLVKENSTARLGCDDRE